MVPFLRRSLQAILLLFALPLASGEAVRLDGGWTFKPGDNPAWAAPSLAEGGWKPIKVGLAWQKQGYEQLQGHAWYRLSFTLPERLRQDDRLKEGLRLSIGQVADFDECYLNGQRVGANGQVAPPDSAPDPDFWKADEGLPGRPRVYVLRPDDPRLRWGQVNVLAVRVYMVSGWGGLTGGEPMEARMIDHADLTSLEPAREPFAFEGARLTKRVLLTNRSSRWQLRGTLEIQGAGLLSGQPVLARRLQVRVAPGGHQEVRFAIPQREEACRFTYRLRFQEGGVPMERIEESPYLLTPKTRRAPRINGPQVLGARPGNPFLWTIPASGQRPLRFKVQGLPGDLRLDPASGMIEGTTPPAGTYPLRIQASNAHGSDTRTVDLVAGPRLALTPPMGWNSWNAWGLAVDEEKVVASARTFVEKGLRDHGWNYVNIDDGWEIPENSAAPKREADGRIRVNGKFPDMARLGRRIHEQGLRFGIYSSPGPATCGGYTGSYGFEAQDAASYAAWGVDYLKYDWCSYSTVAKNLTSLEELQKPYRKMDQALRQVNRDIVYSLCQYGMGDVWTWGEAAGGQLWRTTYDIDDTWKKLSAIGFAQTANAAYAGPGHWNDPDMLVVGWVGWGPSLHPSRLTPDEQYTHLSLWSLLAAPLLIGCDLTRLDAFTLNLLTNDEVLAVDQDRLGRQATPVIQEGSIQVWARELSDGGLAFGVFNLGETAATYRVDLAKLGLQGSPQLRDLWRQKDLGPSAGAHPVRVAPHGVVLLKASRAR
ncbi:MAG: alpha-galactosidase [Acidobacteria bacterium]|nr:alpha-galactosidase [Acidobacteriota bacterium]MBI3488697.1 alpha-galactosidase [Acidobacteriota bacterium]